MQETKIDDGGPAFEISITQNELNRSKRAVVVLAECFKTAMGGKQAPIELRMDMSALMKLLRKLEPIAARKAQGEPQS